MHATAGLSHSLTLSHLLPPHTHFPSLAPLAHHPPNIPQTYTLWIPQDSATWRGRSPHLTSRSLQLIPVQDSDDIRYMAGALKALGIKLEESWGTGEMVVHGCGGIVPSAGAELFLGNAGTAMRPLTAAVAAAGRGK